MDNQYRTNIGRGFLSRLHHMIKEEERKHDEARSRRGALDTEALIDEQVNQSAFYSGGLGEISDVISSDCLNLEGRGWYVGTMIDQSGHSYLVFYDSPRPIYIEGIPGSGKGLQIQSNLAHLAGKYSIAVVDFDDESYNAVREHWENICGDQAVIHVDLNNPAGHKINPLAQAIYLIQQGSIDEALSEIDEVVMTLKPDPAKTGDGHWILKDARELLNTAIYARARYAPETCYLPVIHDDFASTFFDFLATIHSLVDVSTDLYLAKKMEKYETLYRNKPEHGGWWLQEITSDTRYFDKETQLGQALMGNSVDLTRLKTHSTLITIGVKTHRMEQAKTSVSLIMRTITEATSASHGSLRVYTVWDEAPVVGVKKICEWSRTLRKRNVVPIVISQNQAALAAKLGQDHAVDFRSNCGLTQYLSITEQAVAEDLQAMSGTRPSVIRTISANKGPVEQGSISTSTQSEPNLHASDLRVMGQDQQIVKVGGHLLFVMGRIAWWFIDPWRTQLNKF